MNIGAHSKSLADCQQGSIAVIAALVITVLFIGAGFAVDYGAALSKRSTLQAVADSAAVAAAREMSLANATATQIEAAPRQMVSMKLDSNTTGLAVNVLVNEAEASVKVDVQQAVSSYFIGAFAGAARTVGSSATAQIAGTGKVCMVGLNPTSNRTVHLKRNAQLTASDCGVYSNSTSTSSIKIENDGQMTASVICSAGGVSGLSSSFTPHATTDCPALPDPLLDRAPPAVGLCDHTDYSPTGETATATPGVYCGGIFVSANTELTFEPGIYVIKDGPLEVQATAQLLGTNVGFYLVGAATEIRFGGNTTISLSAPVDGEMAGLLFYEDRNNPTDHTHRITSNNARMLLGTLYLPVNPLTIDANAPVADQSAYTALVVKSLTLDAGPNLVLNSDYGATEIPIPGALSGVGGRIVLAK